LFLIPCLLHKKLLTISKEGATDPSAPASLRRCLDILPPTRKNYTFSLKINNFLSYQANLTK
jgi:hypothetical protein